MQESVKPAPTTIQSVREDSLRLLGALSIEIRRLRDQLANAQQRFDAVAADVDALDKVEPLTR